MTRDQERCLWSAVLAEYGAQKLEQMICDYLSLMLREGQFIEQPALVSTEGLAELAGILLVNIVTGERPLLGALRTMNREHFLVLRRAKRRLALLLLADLPIDFVPVEVRRLRAHLDLGV